MTQMTHRLFESTVTVTITLLLIIFTSISHGAKYPGENELKTILKNTDTNLLRGLEGYFYVSEKYFHGNMYQAYKITSAITSEKERAELEWGKLFHGSVDEYKAERMEVLTRNSDGNLKYKGLEGYMEYARKIHAGKMQKAYLNMSAVTSEKEKEELEWGKQFAGSVDEYKAERMEVLTRNSDGNLKYKGLEGYMDYAREIHDGKMEKAYKNMSAVTSEKEKEELEWGKQFHGSVDEYKAERMEVLTRNSDGNLKYKGLEGYMEYAKEIHAGKMEKAYLNMSAVTSEKEKEELEWGKQFAGSVDEYKAERMEVLTRNSDGNLKYKGLEGYMEYARKIHDGKMEKAYKNMSAVTSEKEKEELEWGKLFHGSVDEYKAERAELLTRNSDGNLKYKGLEGYMKYAKEIHAGKMQKAYLNMSAVTSEKEKEELEWGKQFHGSVDEYEAERAELLTRNSDGNLKYKGLEGYMKYAKEIHAGKMLQSYKNMSAVVNSNEKTELDWGRQFHGSVGELREMREILFGVDERERDRGYERWYGKTTGLDLVIEHYLFSKGETKPFNRQSITKARRNFRASVTNYELELLGWSSAKQTKSTAKRAQLCESLI